MGSPPLTTDQRADAAAEAVELITATLRENRERTLRSSSENPSATH
ncbi:MAG: hypothetical protein ABEI11_04490 [Haloarculaceae archaeon]